jgi:hypothetical protein
MTKEEYLEGLKAYINEQMATIQNGGVRHPLSFWVKFNKDKEAEYKAMLQSQGIVVT